MAGYYTPGFPQVGITTVVAPEAGLEPLYPNLLGTELIPMDTGSEQVATVACSAFTLASLAAAITKNTGTATSGAVTLSQERGTITTDSLTTVVGGTYTLTLTNTLVTATSTVLAAVYNGSNTAGGPGAAEIVSITPASGSVVIVIKNVGTATLNGTLVVPFQVF